MSQDSDNVHPSLEWKLMHLSPFPIREITSQPTCGRTPGLEHEPFMFNFSFCGSDKNCSNELKETS